MRSHFQITVTGRGRFPLDMLRYSQIYPRLPNDVCAMEPGAKEKREVTLSMDNASFGTAMNCIDRFASFGWAGEITNEEPLR